MRTTKKQMVEHCTGRFIDAKLKTGKRDLKTKMNGRIPLRRRRSALDCSAIEEEEEEGGEGGGGEEEEEEEEEEEMSFRLQPF